MSSGNSDLKTLNGSNSFTLPKFVISIPCVNGSTTSLVLVNGTVFEIQNLKSPVVLLPSKLYNQLDHLRRNYSTKGEISSGIIVPQTHSLENFSKQTTTENRDISTVQNEILARQQNVREEVEKHLQSHTQIITSYQGKRSDNETFNVLISDDESCYEILDNRPNPDGILAVKETDSDFAILKKLSQRIMTEELAPVPETKNAVKKPKKPPTSTSSPTTNGGSTTATPKNPYLTKATVEVLEKDKDREFQCKVCNKKLASIHSYEMHLKIHTDVKDYLCKTCNKAFRWKASYEAHMYVHRKGKPFKCYQCENSYTYKAGLDQHVANKHSNNRKIYKCELCDRHFMSLSGFKLHQETKHQKVPTSYMCEQCGKSMCSRNSLRNHMITHTGTKPYQCKDCNEWFRTPHTMKRHRLKIHLGKCEKKFQCGTCGKLYYTSSQLKTHEIMHTDARPYKCKDCDRTFRSWTHLRGHRNIHLGIKPNKCAYCPKTFTFYANMLKHVKRHGNDKPHKCDLCPKRFFERQELRKHMVSHQKPPGRDKMDLVVEEPEPEPHIHQQPVILDLAGNYSGGYATYQMI